MSTLAIRLPRKPRRRSLLPALAVLGAVVLGLATGRIADSHYAKLIIEAAAAVGAFAAAVALMARRPRLGVIAILATLVFIPVYRVPTVQGLIFHPMIALCLLVASALFLLTYAGERSRLSAIDMSVMLLTATMLLG